MRALGSAVFAGVMVLLTLQGTGCTGNPSPPSASTQSGSVALTADDRQLLAVDTDNGIVAIIDTSTLAKIGEVKVGALPERIVVSGDLAYVANKGERTVSVLRAESGAADGASRTWHEETRLQVGVEPSALALSADGSRLYVVNSTQLESTESGSLMAFDTKAQQLLWELPVGREPRGLALLEGNRALVSLSKEGDVVTVDLEAQRIVQDGTGLYERANASFFGVAPTSGSGFGGSAEAVPERRIVGPTSTFRPRSLTTLIPTPDGKRAIGALTWASEGVLGGDPAMTPESGGGSSYGGGPCRNGGVAAAGLVTFATEGDRVLPKVDDVSSCNGAAEGADFPLSVLTPRFGGQPMQGPSAVAMDPTGSWLFVVNRESDNVAVFRASRQTPAGDSRGGNTPVAVVAVGSGPNGIAITSDGRRAFVYNAFDHSVSVLGGGDGVVREIAERISVAGEVLAPDAVIGRRLFFSAIDGRMTDASVGVSCASCHPDAREDGHVWLFSDGPRQTPSLAGRMTTRTAPFHWNGEFAALGDFLDVTVRLRMGGQGLNSAAVLQIASFLDAVEAPDNPHRAEAPTAEQARGRHAFEKAQCHTCHEGETFTNNIFADVGTFVVEGPVVDERGGKLSRGLNTPSLLSLSRTYPYLHDGSAQTLEARIREGKELDLHGTTSILSDVEVDDLVAYLKSL